MSLVFTGAHTAFHHQHVKMVDTLINNFKHNRCGLNPYATPCVPRADGNKIEIKEEVQKPKHKRSNKLLDGKYFEWKIPSKKNIIKHNACVDNFQHVGDNNKFSILEDTNEEDDYSVDTKLSADEVFQEPKLSYEIRNLSTKDIDDVMNRHNEFYPEVHESERERNVRSKSIGVH